MSVSLNNICIANNQGACLVTRADALWKLFAQGSQYKKCMDREDGKERSRGDMDLYFIIE